mgnify:CR=1 FL=1
MRNRHLISIVHAGIVASGALLMVGAFVQSPAHAAAPEQGKGAMATYVGEKVCAKCHDPETKQFGHTLHAKVFRLEGK